MITKTAVYKVIAVQILYIDINIELYEYAVHTVHNAKVYNSIYIYIIYNRYVSNVGHSG